MTLALTLTLTLTLARWARLPQSLLLLAIDLLLQTPLKLGLGVGALHRSACSPKGN